MTPEEVNDSGNGASAHINPEAGATSEAAEAAESPQAERPEGVPAHFIPLFQTLEVEDEALIQHPEYLRLPNNVLLAWQQHASVPADVGHGLYNNLAVGWYPPDVERGVDGSGVRHEFVVAGNARNSHWDLSEVYPQDSSGSAAATQAPATDLQTLVPLFESIYVERLAQVQHIWFENPDRVLLGRCMAPGIPQDIRQGLTTGIDIGYYQAETPREPGHPNVVAQHYRDLAYLQQRRILTAADRTEPTNTITVISKRKRRSARQMPPGELLPLEKAALYDEIIFIQAIMDKHGKDYVAARDECNAIMKKKNKNVRSFRDRSSNNLRKLANAGAMNLPWKRETDTKKTKKHKGEDRKAIEKGNGLGNEKGNEEGEDVKDAGSKAKDSAVNKDDKRKSNVRKRKRGDDAPGPAPKKGPGSGGDGGSGGFGGGMVAPTAVVVGVAH